MEAAARTVGLRVYALYALALLGASTSLNAEGVTLSRPRVLA